MTRSSGSSSATAGIGRADQPPYDQADTPATYPPLWRSIVWPIVLAVLAVLGMLAGGVSPWRAVVIATGSAITLWALSPSFNIVSPSWPLDVSWQSTRTPSPWEVSGLWAISNAPDTYTNYLQPRLWQLTCELLIRRGIDPDSEEAVELLGHRQHALLSGADTNPNHISISVAPLCLAISRAAVTNLPNNPAPITNPALTGLAGRVTSASTER